MAPYVDVLTTPNALVDQLQIAVRAGHCCYQSEGKTPLEAFLRRLIESGHESVLEHASISFRMVTNRAVTHQLVRHRIASYSQESMRYCKYKNQVVFIEPPIGTFANEEVRKVWVDSCREAAIRYQALLEAGSRNPARRCPRRSSPGHQVRDLRHHESAGVPALPEAPHQPPCPEADPSAGVQVA